MKEKKYKLVFFGTPKISADLLERLVKLNNYEIPLVVTQKDKPKGRGKKITPPPVKEVAQRHNIKVIQPEKLDKKTEEMLKKIKPDIFLVFAYGKIIPKKILNIPKFGSINIHGSLLPKYRGASPVQSAILNGDKTTGVTLMLMDEKLDHGPIIAQKRIKISKNETSKSLFEKLLNLAFILVKDKLHLFIKGEIKPKQQNHKKATYTGLIKKEDGKINPKVQTASKIERMFKAFYPWPGIFIQLKKNNGELLRVKILDLKVLKKCKKDKNYLYLEKDKLILKTKRGCLELIFVQPESKNKMSGKEFFLGYKNQINLQYIP